MNPCTQNEKTKTEQKLQSAEKRLYELNSLSELTNKTDKMYKLLLFKNLLTLSCDQCGAIKHSNIQKIKSFQSEVLNQSSILLATFPIVSFIQNSTCRFIIRSGRFFMFNTNLIRHPNSWALAFSSTSQPDSLLSHLKRPYDLLRSIQVLTPGEFQ